jgi:hypothetical protein
LCLFTDGLTKVDHTVSKPLTTNTVINNPIQLIPTSNHFVTPKSETVNTFQSGASVNSYFIETNLITTTPPSAPAFLTTPILTSNSTPFSTSIVTPNPTPSPTAITLDGSTNVQNVNQFPFHLNPIPGYKFEITGELIL